MFTSLSLEASFPIGIPEEYGIFGGIFLDAGSVWGLDNTQVLEELMTHLKLDLLQVYLYSGIL